MGTHPPIRRLSCAHGSLPNPPQWLRAWASYEDANSEESLQVHTFFHRLAHMFKPRSANVKHGANFDLGEIESNKRHDDAIALSMLTFVALQVAPQLCDLIELVLTKSLLDALWCVGFLISLGLALMMRNHLSRATGATDPMGQCRGLTDNSSPTAWRRGAVCIFLNIIFTFWVGYPNPLGAQSGSSESNVVVQWASSGSNSYDDIGIVCAWNLLRTSTCDHLWTPPSQLIQCPSNNSSIIQCSHHTRSPKAPCQCLMHTCSHGACCWLLLQNKCIHLARLNATAAQCLQQQDNLHQ